MTVPTKPNPGSEEAQEQGCTCAIVDNHYGKGFGTPPQFWISDNCPLHAMPQQPTKGSGISTIYLMASRKQWDYKLPDGWKELAWERFDYIECGIYEKATAELTEKDKEWIESYNSIPDGWIEPTKGSGGEVEI